MRFVFQAALIDILDVPSEEAKRRFLVIYIAQQFNCHLHFFFFLYRTFFEVFFFFSFSCTFLFVFFPFFLFFFFTYINSNIAALSVSCVGRALAFVLL